jgi:hypothetical protein
MSMLRYGIRVNPLARNPLPDYGAVLFAGWIHFAYQSR